MKGLAHTSLESSVSLNSGGDGGVSLTASSTFGSMFLQDCVSAMCRWLSVNEWAGGVKCIVTPVDLRNNCYFKGHCWIILVFVSRPCWRRKWPENKGYNHEQLMNLWEESHQSKTCGRGLSDQGSRVPSFWLDALLSMPLIQVSWHHMFAYLFFKLDR